MSDYDSAEQGYSPREPKRGGFTVWLRGIWCRLFHRGVMLPIHGYYQCRRCFRRIPISFEMGGAGEDPSARRRR